MVAEEKKSKSRFLQLLKRLWQKNSVIVVFVFIIILCGIAAPRFLRPENLFNILRNTSIVGVIALGMTFVIIGGGIDLSSGPVLATSGAVLSGFQVRDSRWRRVGISSTSTRRRRARSTRLTAIDGVLWRMKSPQPLCSAWPTSYDSMISASRRIAYSYSDPEAADISLLISLVGRLPLRRRRAKTTRRTQPACTLTQA